MNTPGVAADLSHIATPARVAGFLPPDEGLTKALAGAQLVIIPAGVPRKPGVSSIDVSSIKDFLNSHSFFRCRGKSSTHIDYTSIDG